MRILIIEDEPLTTADLADTISQVEPSAMVIARMASVKEAIAFFEQRPAVDLVFSDIRLGDGLSFEIFKQVPIQVPVVFCTAYDAYALAAFKANGIDYILKPFTTDDIRTAIGKYKGLTAAATPAVSAIAYESILQQFHSSRKSVLVYYKDKIIAVPISDIALFYISSEINHLVSFQGDTYIVSRTMEEMEQLTGKDFYRASRKTLVNRKAIKEVEQLSQRKLLIHLALDLPVAVKESLTVSKERISHFLHWLSGS
jgi:two-component system response regulator LytT